MAQLGLGNGRSWGTEQFSCKLPPESDGGERSECNLNACIRSEGLESLEARDLATVGKWKTMMTEGRRP